MTCARNQPAVVLQAELRDFADVEFFVDQQYSPGCHTLTIGHRGQFR
jgi:hypothetical protein